MDFRIHYTIYNKTKSCAVDMNGGYNLTTGGMEREKYSKGLIGITDGG